MGDVCRGQHRTLVRSALRCGGVCKVASVKGIAVGDKRVARSVEVLAWE